MTENHENSGPAIVHIVPRGRLWRVIRGEGPAGESATYPDLGRALDEATRGPVLVHVVVHPSDTACDAA